MDKDVAVTFAANSPDDRERHERLVRLLALGVARVLAVAVKADVDLSADVRVTTTTAPPGGGSDS